MAEDPFIKDFIESLFIFERGILPGGGGWFDQAAWWVEAVSRILPYKADCDKWQAKKMQEEARREAQKAKQRR